MGLQGLAWVFVVLMTNLHDFHYSRTDLRWNPNTSTWQMEVRVFTDDLESALSLRTEDETAFFLGDDKERTDADNMISDWVDEGCGMTVGGEALVWSYLGKEVDFDITYLYVESNPIAEPAAFTLEWTLFFDLFDDQVNEVALNLNGIEQRELFSHEMPSRIFMP